MNTTLSEEQLWQANRLTLLKIKCMELANKTSENITQDYNTPYCDVAFDGLTCWPATPAGQTAERPCPDFILGWDKRRSAFRECTENGTWFKHPSPPHKEWSNYTTCVDYEDLQFRQFVNNLYVIGYSISLAAIIISLVIFFTFRTLRCTRIRIHMHLFISFALNNSMWLVWYKHVIPDTEVLKQNPLWCQALHIVIHYLMVANYLWMFCEGLHLHLALVVVFVRDAVAMRYFMALGWLAPALLVSIYAAVRVRFGVPNQQCWMLDTHAMWILTAPVFVSLIASMVFLINVVRVLLTKLHPSSAHPAPAGMRKAVRATLILVPLFGLHLVLIPHMPDPDSPHEHAYQVFAAILVSLQGFCVSCLFCFANQDVLSAVLNGIRRMCPYWAGNNGGGGGVGGYTGTLGDSAPAFAVNGSQVTQRDVVV